MTKKRMAIGTKRLAWVAGAALVLIALGARPAAAYTQAPACSPNVVQYEAATQLLIVQCGGTNYWAQTLTSGTCTMNSRSIDQQKLFMSLAESALLAGKNVNIYYNWCGGANHIEAIDLTK